MAYKLLDAAQDRWLMIDGAELTTQLLDRATLKDGIEVANDQNTTVESVVAHFFFDAQSTYP